MVVYVGPLFSAFGVLRSWLSIRDGIFGRAVVDGLDEVGLGWEMRGRFFIEGHELTWVFFTPQRRPSPQSTQRLQD